VCDGQPIGPRAHGFPDALVADLEEVRTAVGGPSFGNSAVVPAGAHLACRLIALIGLGDQTELDIPRFRAGLELGLRSIRLTHITKVAMTLAEVRATHLREEALVASVIEIATLSVSDHRIPAHDAEIDELWLATSCSVDDLAREASILGRAVNEARGLVNAPASVLTPREFESKCREIAGTHGIAFELLDAEQLLQRGYRGLHAIGAGSAHAPSMVILTTGSPGEPIDLAIVGKGVTFDSGGLSLKPADAQRYMKADMGGAAAALGAIDALASLGSDANVAAILCLAENMPSANAMRPGDVIETPDGLTVEVADTDFEGRLALADGLHYARQLRPRNVVDVATLTRAQRVALGPVAGAFVTPSKPLREALIEAAETAGERLWELPLYPEYRALNVSSIADLSNAPPLEAGVQSAAAFLRQFAGNDHWAHLDISAAAFNAAPMFAELPRGATGYGVRILAHLPAALTAVAADSTTP
jgi:leucyl aminopeptidase